MTEIRRITESQPTARAIERVRPLEETQPYGQVLADTMVCSQKAVCGDEARRRAPR